MGVLATIGLTAALGTGGGKVSSVGYEILRQGRATYHVITANMASGRIGAETVHSPRLTSAWSLVERTEPVAAITGTFFSPASHIPVADVLVDGELVSRGSRGTAIGVSYFDGNIKIFDRPYREAVDWSPYQFGLRGAVRVLSKGKVCPNPKAQKFRDSAIWGRAARTGIALTKHGKVMLVATASAVTLSDLAKAMKAKGGVDGVSLDGGTSTCLYYNGKMLISPGRNLSNLFVLTVKPSMHYTAR